MGRHPEPVEGGDPSNFVETTGGFDLLNLSRHPELEFAVGQDL